MALRRLLDTPMRAASSFPFTRAVTRSTFSWWPVGRLAFMARNDDTCHTCCQYSHAVFSTNLSADVSKRANLADVKSDIERGPFGAWAYATRDSLELSVEQVAAELGYHPASLRKMEAGTPASRRMKREIPDYYARIANERGKRIAAAPVDARAPADDSDVAAAIREQTEVMREQTAVFTRLAVALERALALPGGIGGLGVSADLAAAAGAAGDEQAMRTVEAVAALPVAAGGSEQPGTPGTRTQRRSIPAPSGR